LAAIRRVVTPGAMTTVLPGAIIPLCAPGARWRNGPGGKKGEGDRPMRTAKRVGLGLAAAGLLAVLAVAGVILADRLAQPPPADPKSLIARAGAYHVRIRRDDFGVPHILGRA